MGMMDTADYGCKDQARSLLPDLRDGPQEVSSQDTCARAEASVITQLGFIQTKSSKKSHSFEYIFVNIFL